MDSPTNRVMEVYGSEWEEDMDGLLVRVPSEEDVAFWRLSITHIFGLLSGTSGDENLNQKNPL